MKRQATPKRPRKAKRPDTLNGTIEVTMPDGSKHTVAIRDGLSDPIPGPWRQGELVSIGPFISNKTAGGDAA